MGKDLATNRNISLDIMKCFGIYLVVVGHVLQRYINYFDNNILFNIIYSFHMPFFIFLSGYTLKFEKVSTKGLVKRFKLLIIPFLAWAIVSYFCFHMDKSFLIYFRNIILFPDTGLWFLWVLFLCYVVVFISKQISNKFFFTVVPAFALLALSAILHTENFLSYKTLSRLYPFFVFGICFSRLIDGNTFIKSLYRNEVKVLLIMIFLILASQWHRSGSNAIFTFLGISNRFAYLYDFVTSMTGILSFYLLFSHVENVNKIALGFQNIGMSTLGIYAIHQFFLLDYPFAHCYGVLSIMFFVIFPIALLLISYLITLLLRKNKLSSILLLGK